MLPVTQGKKRLIGPWLFGCWLTFLFISCVTVTDELGRSDQSPDPVFRYSLRLYSPEDLERAFRSGRILDTTGLQLHRCLVGLDHDVPTGPRQYVDLMKKTVGESTLKLILSRGQANNAEVQVYGEVMLLRSVVRDTILEVELIGEFLQSGHEVRVMRMGWHERALHCDGRQIKKRDGEEHSVITFLYKTNLLRIEEDSIRGSDDWLATSDVVDLGTDLRKYLEQ